MILGTKTVRFETKIPIRLMLKIREVAEQQGITPSDVIREALLNKYLGDIIDDLRSEWKAMKRLRRRQD